MVDYREIIRLNSLKFSNVGIANSISCSRNTVSEVLTNRDIELLFYSERVTNEGRKHPDFEYIYKELAKSGVTLSLLWAEYCTKCE